MSLPNAITTTPQHTPFHLVRWVGSVAAVLIALMALSMAWLMSSFLTEHMFRREAEVSRDFVQNILSSDGSVSLLDNPQDAVARQRFANSIEHLSNMRDVLRANVYGRSGLMVWSSDDSLIGRSFSDNDELEEAMKGELVVHAGRIDDAERAKPEHEGLSRSVLFFVETYIPVRAANGAVVGAVELYKAPLALTEAIHESRVRVALLAGVSGVLLFLGLFGLIRRADRTMRAQHAQLMDAQTSLALGELAASVAHNIRNPLASIRSAAELCLDDPAGLGPEHAREILQDVDRVSARITELLRLSAPGSQTSEPVAIDVLLRGLAVELAPAFERRGHRLVLQAVPDVVVRGDAGLLGQVLRSLIVNAREAMSDGSAGQCLVRVAREGKGWVRIDIEDNGPGMSPEVAQQVFRPFFTTKPQGLGLGLPLARRIVERMGGRLSLLSSGPAGTQVRIELPES